MKGGGGGGLAVVEVEVVGVPIDADVAFANAFGLLDGAPRALQELRCACSARGCIAVSSSGSRKRAPLLVERDREKTFF